MIKLMTIEQIRKIEAQADSTGFSYAQMMDNAGYATARYAMHMLKNNLDKPRITILVGSGNNGGDGLVAGRYLAEDGGFDVRFYLLKRLDVSYLPYQAIESLGLFMAYATDDQDGRVLRHMVAGSDLIVDALLGIGGRTPITGDLARIMRLTRQAIRGRITELLNPPIISPTHPTFLSHHKPRVLAVDCPSGVNCDTGEIDEIIIPADSTITFIAPKVGLVKYPATQFVGDMVVAPIDIPQDLPGLKEGIGELVTGQMIKSYLPARPSESNKGTFGKVLIIGGSHQYIGAMHLSALGAYRAGAGVVTVATPAPSVSILAGNLPEATWLPLAHTDGMVSPDSIPVILGKVGIYESLLIGPGLGQSPHTESFIKEFFTDNVHYPDKQVLNGTHPTIRHLLGKDTNRLNAPNLVLDADALNILAKIDNWWEFIPPYTIITPHPGEMARLCRLSVQEIQANRWELALQKAKAWRVIILLKGAHTVVATPEGNLSILPFKNDALATAGTGDILAGVIVGLLAGGAMPFHATVAGGYIHGLAGEIAYAHHRDGRSVVASDILACIPTAFGQINVL